MNFDQAVEDSESATPPKMNMEPKYGSDDSLFISWWVMVSGSVRRASCEYLFVVRLQLFSLVGKGLISGTATS